MLREGSAFSWPPQSKDPWIVKSIVGPYEYDGSYLVELHRFLPSPRKRRTEPMYATATVWWHPTKGYVDFEENTSA